MILKLKSVNFQFQSPILGVLLPHFPLTPNPLLFLSAYARTLGSSSFYRQSAKENRLRAHKKLLSFFNFYFFQQFFYIHFNHLLFS